MNHRPISLWLPFVLLVACGGGGGDALPLSGNATAGDPIPPNSDDPAPNNDDPPPPPDGPTVGGDPGGGDPGGGDDCSMACTKVVARGCDTSQGECVSGCHDLATQECGPELQALLICAASSYCPEELANLDLTNLDLLTAIAAMCPTQTGPYIACSQGTNQ